MDLKMRTKNSFIALFALALIVASVNKSSAQSALANAKKSKTTQLFNGDDLTGWYIFLKDRGINNDPQKVFTVKNKTIRISGEEWGCITTNNEYENYVIEMEFKWGEKTFGKRATKARDSGLLLHSQGINGGVSGIWMHSIEYNIIEGGTGDFIVVGDKTDKFGLTSNVIELKDGSKVFKPAGEPISINKGRIDWLNRDPNWKDVLGFRGKKDIEKPVGQWNKIKCVVNGNRITSYLNKVLVNEAYNVKPSKGRIQIQSEGAEIFFRKITLTRIKGSI